MAIRFSLQCSVLLLALPGNTFLIAQKPLGLFELGSHDCSGLRSLSRGVDPADHPAVLCHLVSGCEGVCPASG